MYIFAAATVGTQPDYIALAMVGALLVTVVVMVLKKRFGTPNKEQTDTIVSVEEISNEPVTAPGSAGQLKLNNVDPKTAAILMAIVAEKTGKPLNELRFISVKEVK